MPQKYSPECQARAVLWLGGTRLLCNQMTQFINRVKPPATPLPPRSTTAQTDPPREENDADIDPSHAGN